MRSVNTQKAVLLEGRGEILPVFAAATYVFNRMFREDKVILGTIFPLWLVKDGMGRFLDNLQTTALDGGRVQQAATAPTHDDSQGITLLCALDERQSRFAARSLLSLPIDLLDADSGERIRELREGIVDSLRESGGSPSSKFPPENGIPLELNNPGIRGTEVLIDLSVYRHTNAIGFDTY